MKKKLLGSLIALGGSVLAVGTAFAVYTGTLPEDKSIQIGTKTSGDIVLHGGVVDADSDHRVLTPTAHQRTIEFSAGFTTPDSSVYIQDYYLAKLEFKISSATTGVIAALKEHSWIELGVQSGSNAYGSYWGWTWSDDTELAQPHTGTRGSTTAQNHLNSGVASEATDHKSVSWSTHYPLFKGEAVSRFLFHVNMEGISDADYKEIAESSYTVDFNISEPDSGYGMSYVVGTATGGWEDKEEFRMTVNAQASGYEWMFKTGTVEGRQKLVAGEYKLHNGSTYCHPESTNHTWSTTDDGKTFYWNVADGKLYLNTTAIHDPTL